MQKAEMAPGVERDAVADSEAAERQAVASPCDFRGACSVGGGIRFAPRAPSWGGLLTGSCAPGRSLHLGFQVGRGGEVEDVGRAWAEGPRTR